MARVRFRFKNLVVYQVALRFFAWSVGVAERIPRSRFFLLDQFVRTALSIMLNIAEGSGLWRLGNKRKHYEIARGSTFESAAILDALRVTGTISDAEFDRQEEELASIGAMLTRLIQRYEKGGAGEAARARTPRAAARVALGAGKVARCREGSGMPGRIARCRKVARCREGSGMPGRIAGCRKGRVVPGRKRAPRSPRIPASPRVAREPPPSTSTTTSTKSRA